GRVAHAVSQSHALAFAPLSRRIAPGVDGRAVPGPDRADHGIGRSEFREPAGAAGADGIPVWRQFLLRLAGPAWRGVAGLAIVRSGSVCSADRPAAVFFSLDAGAQRSGLSSLFPALPPEK